jgi:hypothetical protein
MDVIEVRRRSRSVSERAGKACILMFSGGRDSSLAALRLVKSGLMPTLVTITSDHLFGIEAVRLRLTELRRVLPGSIRWLRVDQPKELATDTSFYAQTCLPCHHAYVVVAAAIARSLRSSRLAFGYTGYQSGWPEQTPLATDRLRRVLAEYDITLDLPVLDLASREEAQAELAQAGLSSDALEQKCSRQITNVELRESALVAQIDLWEDAIRRSMDALDSIPTAIAEDVTLDDFEASARW